MNQKVTLPVLTEIETMHVPDSIEPASQAQEKIKNKIISEIEDIQIDEESLQKCIASIGKLSNQSAEKLSDNESVSLDSISVQLGISLTGEVGFLGTGVKTGISTSLNLVFKIKS